MSDHHEGRPADPTSESPAGLHRSLGLGGVFSIVTGAMISSGLFVLPGIAFAAAGPAAVFSYALASLLVVPVMLSKAELATAMPRSGGAYFFVDRSLGPLAGTLAGLANWLAVSLKAAFALVGLGAVAELLAGGGADPLLLKSTAVAGCLVFTVVNLLGVSHVGRLQSFLVAGMLAILAVFIVGSVGHVQPARFQPFAPHGWHAVFSVAGLVFVSYGGLTKVIGVAEEVRNPARNLPLGMFLGAALVSVLYVVVVFIVVGTLDAGDLGGSLTPVASAARNTLGTAGLVALEVAAILAFATTANSGLLAASRCPMAMARDGLLPERLSRTHARRGTPVMGLLITAGFLTAVIVLLSVEDLVKTASTMMLMMFLLVNVAVIIMRQSRLGNYRPTFRAPLYPYLQVASIVIYLVLIVEMGTVPLLLTAGFVLASVVWYLFYIARRIDRESALVYLVKRVISREIVRSNLEDELKQIVLERDEISLDRFDRLVRSAVVLDLEGPIDARQMFHSVADGLAERLGMPAEKIYELLLDRERQTSTVVTPGVAIPHIVVPGEGLFELLLVRVRGEGARFDELHPPVVCAFVLVGSVDERNYHLRALMHIAHVVESTNFQQRWQAAPGPEALRDVVFLAKRRREQQGS
jgi:amino acid transporter/mannitol/fructose-specific phosphotransferase system IIA component (Ntr-type)